MERSRVGVYVAAYVATAAATIDATGRYAQGGDLGSALLEGLGIGTVMGAVLAPAGLLLDKLLTRQRDSDEAVVFQPPRIERPVIESR